MTQEKQLNHPEKKEHRPTSMGTKLACILFVSLAAIAAIFTSYNLGRTHGQLAAQKNAPKSLNEIKKDLKTLEIGIAKVQIEIEKLGMATLAESQFQNQFQKSVRANILELKKSIAKKNKQIDLYRDFECNADIISEKIRDGLVTKN